MTASSGRESVCPGCGLTMPADDSAAYDGYYNTSPECRGVYAEVLGAEYGDPALYGRVHQLTVDAYAVQHAGAPHPDKSVALHLLGLHLVIERDFRSTGLPRLRQDLADRARTWAEKVWEGWSEHHPEVAAFASRNLDPVRR